LLLCLIFFKNLKSAITHSFQIFLIGWIIIRHLSPSNKTSQPMIRGSHVIYDEAAVWSAKAIEKKNLVLEHAEAVWSSGRAFASDPAGHGFKSGRQLWVILFRCTGRTLVYHLCSPHMSRPCLVTPSSSSIKHICKYCQD